MFRNSELFENMETRKKSLLGKTEKSFVILLYFPKNEGKLSKLTHAIQNSEF